MTSSASAPTQANARTVFRVTSGNFLEMYDFMVFGYYASAIADTFSHPKPLRLADVNADDLRRWLLDATTGSHRVRRLH